MIKVIIDVRMSKFAIEDGRMIILGRVARHRDAGRGTVAVQMEGRGDR